LPALTPCTSLTGHISYHASCLRHQSGVSTFPPCRRGPSAQVPRTGSRRPRTAVDQVSDRPAGGLPARLRLCRNVLRAGDEALYWADRRGAEDEPAESPCGFLNEEDGGRYGSDRPDAGRVIAARGEVGHGGRVRSQTPPPPREVAGDVLAAVGRLVQ